MASISQLTARLIDLFGAPSTANPTKLLNNLTITPSGNVAVGSGTDDSTGNKLQVAGTIGINGTTANYRATNYYTSGSIRWVVGADSSAESGSNAGSNWFINRYTDAAAYIDTPLMINRKTGVLTTSQRPVFNGQTAVTNSTSNGITLDWGVNKASNVGITIDTSYQGYMIHSGNMTTLCASYSANKLVLAAGAGAASVWNWSGQSGTPAWVWGGSDGTNMYVWSPSTMSVNYATSCGTANALVGGTTINGSLGVTGTFVCSGTVNGNASTWGYLQSANAFANQSSGSYAGVAQGSYMGWNDSNGGGEGMLCCNKGGGSGGWVLRTVNVNNSAESGRFTVSPAGVGTNGSDIRLKDDVQTVFDCLDKIRSIRGVSYKYKSNGERHYGVIAQEVKPVFPHAVTTTHSSDEHDDLLGVSYNDLIAPLIEAVKELANKVDAQAEEIASLKEQLGNKNVSTTN